MVETDWFWMTQDPEMAAIRGAQDFSRRRFPYFMDEAAFSAIEDGTAFYEYAGRPDPSDFLFEPTLLVHDRLQAILSCLAPEMRFKSLHLIDKKRKEKAPAPLYWIPYLPYSDVLHPSTRAIQGKTRSPVLARKATGDSRILHCRLPAQDIWLLSLEAAECILRRCPVGIRMEQVTVL